MKQCHLSLKITHWVSFELALEPNCEFWYDTHDPLAVTLVFDTYGKRPAHWVFSRDLLAEGMTARAGEGDVVLWPLYDLDDEPCSFSVRVGGARTALFEIPTGPVAQWLDATYAMVPRGAELDGFDWNELLQPAE
ncbi:SsgA family sporulation/cell division regulator [Streptomyces sp. NPDC002677]|uniref:SsgA family sporulation/cell division regulator n=1 Tax=Streptomyces sp. NPDC002677 TaxID=3154774 RepID=UPI003321E035